MGSSRTRNSTRAGKARSVKPTPRHKPTLSPAAMAKRLASRKRYTGKPSPTKVLRELRHNASGEASPTDDEAQDLYAILHELVLALSVIRTAKQSLEHQDSNRDAIVTLEAGIKMLRRVDHALNCVADGRPSSLIPTDEHDTDDEEVGHD
jgi:hypothetical protein